VVCGVVRGREGGREGEERRLAHLAGYQNIARVSTPLSPSPRATLAAVCSVCLPSSIGTIDTVHVAPPPPFSIFSKHGWFEGPTSQERPRR
jgi:hypothetical protein